MTQSTPKVYDEKQIEIMKQVTPKLDERQKFEITATDGFLRKPTNLRNHRGNLRDFTSFKKLSRNINLPDF